MRTMCHANKFVKEASATSLMAWHEILMSAGPHNQIYSTSIRPLHYLHMCLTALSGIAHRVMCFTFVWAKNVLGFCCVWWCSHFQVIFSTVTDTPCMFMVADSFCITCTGLASDKALSIMRRTEQTLCLSFILIFLLQVSSEHYLSSILASSPGNHIPGHCRRLTVSCVMRSAGQLSNTQALGFRCLHCSCEFETRHGMNVHRRMQSSAGTGCADPSNSTSVSFTGRASISSSIVREHAFLGAYKLMHTKVIKSEYEGKLTMT